MTDGTADPLRLLGLCRRQPSLRAAAFDDAAGHRLADAAGRSGADHHEPGNPDAGQGVRLDINARGELEAVLAQGGRTETVASGAHAGARVVSGGLAIDAEEGVLTLHQVPHRVYARVDDRARVQQRQSAPALDGQTLLAFAATPAPAAASSARR